MKILNIINKIYIKFGERLAIIPIILVFGIIFTFERVGDARAQEKIFRQNITPEGLQVLVGSFENIDFGNQTDLLPVIQKTIQTEPQNTISVKVESVRVPVTPTPTPKPVVASSGDVWENLAKCESKGNWSINTGNGYFGGLQFSQGAWNSVGGSGVPSDASKEEQIERGKQLQLKRGWGAWGMCAKKLGLN